jgi:putative zinc finger/helix-turn-helix YgiT family protein
MNDNLVRLPSAEMRVCDECGARAAQLSFQEERFPYGAGDEAVELSARVPVWVCGHCGHSYTDGDAEDARQEAVCKHLGVLAPSEIRATRRMYEMSQAEFAKVTGFGLASVKRWEAGSLVQNVAADRLLRLLRSDAAIMVKLMAIDEARTAEAPGAIVFQTPVSNENRAAAAEFVLRRVGR